MSSIKQHIISNRLNSAFILLNFMHIKKVVHFQLRTKTGKKKRRKEEKKESKVQLIVFNKRYDFQRIYLATCSAVVSSLSEGETGLALHTVTGLCIRHPARGHFA